jgi:hypothetical protein
VIIESHPCGEEGEVGEGKWDQEMEDATGEKFLNSWTDPFTAGCDLKALKDSGLLVIEGKARALRYVLRTTPESTDNQPTIFVTDRSARFP